MSTPIVIVTRPPDSSNEHAVFGGEAVVYNIDLGYMDLSDPDEYLEWAQAHLAAAQAMLDEHGEGPYGEAASHIRSVVEENVPQEILDAGHWMGGDTSHRPDWSDILLLIEAPTHVCRHCQRGITNIDGQWIDPEATGDDSMWRETCGGLETWPADHEPEEAANG